MSIIIIITTTTTNVVATYQIVPDYITNPLIITFVNAGLTEISVTQFSLPFPLLIRALLAIRMSFFFFWTKTLNFKNFTTCNSDATHTVASNMKYQTGGIKLGMCFQRHCKLERKEPLGQTLDLCTIHHTNYIIYVSTSLNKK